MPKMPTNPSKGGKYSGSSGFNSSRNPPPRTGAPGAHRKKGCPLFLLLFPLWPVIIAWNLIRKRER